MKVVLLRFWVILMKLDIIQSHIRLLFPPARYPNLDFLDSSQTVGPCGVYRRPPGPGTHTTLLTNSTLNLSWFMAYPHRGGYRMELLDSSEQLKVVLTPSGDLVGSLDQTKERDSVRLPEEPCQNCVIRLVRQAEEWGANYNFWSCADVNIVKERSPEEMCSGKGRFARGRCFCERLHSGEFCQSEDECHAHSHCGLDKSCKFLTDRTLYPQWACFNTNSFFHDPTVPIPLSLFDPSQFRMREVGDGNKIYWQILEAPRQIKFVLQFKTRTWIAVGWKPLNLDPAKCKNLAFGIKWTDQDLSVPEPEISPEEFIPVVQPEQQRETDTVSGTEHACAGSWQYPDGCSGSQCEYRIHWVFGGEQEEIGFFLEAKIPQNNWWTGVGFSPSGRMSDADMLIVKIQDGSVSLFDMNSNGYTVPSLDEQQDVFTRIAPTLAYKNGRLNAMFGRKLNTRDFRNDVIFNRSNCVHFLFPVGGGPIHSSGNIEKHILTPRVSVAPICMGPCRVAQNKRKAKRNSSDRFSRQAPAFQPNEQFRTHSTLHPMDCADIVIGSVEGNAWRIYDYYTVSKATPRIDEFYNGIQSIRESIGFEREGLTTLIFQKDLETLDPADHSVTPGPMTLIWAHGQEIGHYHHSPDSALEISNSQRTDFYEPYVPRYHGIRNRGVLTVDFYE